MTNPAVKADAIKQLDMLATLAGLTTYSDLHKLGSGLLEVMEATHNNWHRRHAPGEALEQFNYRVKAIEAARRVLTKAAP